MNILHIFKWRVCPCGREIIVMAADDATEMMQHWFRAIRDSSVTQQQIIYDHGQHFNNCCNLFYVTS